MFQPTPQNLANMKALVKAQTPAVEVARLLFCNNKTVYNWVRRWGLEYRPRHGNRTPEQTEKRIEDLYLAKETPKRISQVVGLTPEAVNLILRRRGIEARHDRRKYHFNEMFFATLTPCSSYWLGFLAADGSVGKKTLTLAVAAQDRSHLIRFVSAIEATHPIGSYRRKDGGEMVRICLYSKLLLADLASYGVVPRKTHVIDWPRNIPDDLLPHFLRGLVDGDGCWMCSNGQRVFRITGTRRSF